MIDKYRKIKASGLSLLGVSDLSIILGIKPQSARVIASRMVKKRLLIRLKKDLYMLDGEEIDPFTIANKLIEPSYISFESALAYWNMTSQISQVITSAARRSKTIIAMKKEFIFSHLPTTCFNLDIIRKGNFFIASKEKAFLDLFYYATLGKKSITFDDIDTSKLDQDKLRQLMKHYPAAIKPKLKEVFSGLNVI